MSILLNFPNPSVTFSNCLFYLLNSKKKIYIYTILSLLLYVTKKKHQITKSAMKEPLKVGHFWLKNDKQK